MENAAGASDAHEEAMGSSPDGRACEWSDRRVGCYRERMARVDDVVAFVLEQSGTMTTYKLQKLLYYAQGWSLAWDDRPLFDAKIKAYDKGPCVGTVFNDRRCKGLKASPPKAYR